MNILAAIPKLFLAECHPLTLARAPGWKKLRRHHLDMFPFCATCGGESGCVPHHIKPVHLFPELELEPSNLVTLCPDHHLLIGHLMLWASWNRHVLIDCAEWRRKILNRP